ncbi:MAG: mandelate racemase/muconate lactonizing enzyme family protein [Streptosporangiales bacterium]|nr:mandelate racemase/muconate lactonizing enzyme family protein [Streptosporangiales bacterium]
MTVIERLDVFPLRVPLDHPYGSARGLIPARQLTLVRLTTSDGAIGWGEGYGTPAVVAAAVEDLAPTVRGRELDPPGPWAARILQQGYHNGDGGALFSAVSAVDTATWDALGHTLGRSVGRLLGGRARDHVTAYASTGFTTETRDLDEFTEMVRSGVEAGFPAAKIKLGVGFPEDRRRAEAARTALDPDRAMMIDLNGNCTADVAAATVARLRDLDPYWVEEPVPPQDLPGLREIRPLGVPVAIGEALYGRQSFREPIAARLTDIVQPDVAKVGGLTEARAVTELARAFGVRVSPHCWGGAIAQAATLQLLAALPPYPHVDNPPEKLWFELDRSYNPLRDELITEPFTARDGRIDIPDLPGLGVTVDEAALRAFRLDR